MFFSIRKQSIRNINSFLNFPVAQPSNDGVSDADMRMRQYRLMTANALISNQSSSPPRRGGPPISSDDDDDVIDDFALGLPFPRTPPRAGSPSEYLGLPVPLPVVFSPPTAVTNNNRGSMNYLRNHQQQPNQGRFCPFARSHRLGSQNPQSAHHHPLYAAMDWPIPLSQPTSRQFQQFEPPIPESGSSDHQSNRSSGYSPFYSYVEPIAHPRPRPQAAHANNDSFSGNFFVISLLTLLDLYELFNVFSFIHYRSDETTAFEPSASASASKFKFKWRFPQSSCATAY